MSLCAAPRDLCHLIHTATIGLGVRSITLSGTVQEGPKMCSLFIAQGGMKRIVPVIMIPFYPPPPVSTPGGERQEEAEEKAIRQLWDGEYV